MPTEHYFKGLEIPSQIHNGTDGRKGKDGDGKMQIVPITLHDWSQFPFSNQEWNNMKQHFGEAYKNLLISGRGVGVLGNFSDAQ